jgi:hypothetical protein
VDARKAGGFCNMAHRSTELICNIEGKLKLVDGTLERCNIFFPGQSLISCDTVVGLAEHQVETTETITEYDDNIFGRR